MKMTLTAQFHGNYAEYVIGPIQIDMAVPDFEEFKGPDNFRLAFHDLEQAVLSGRNELGRLAVQEYLKEMTRNRVDVRIEGQEGVMVKESPLPYKIEAELGRLSVSTYRAEKGNQTICDSKTDILPRIGPREAFRSPCYEWLQSKLATDNDYRATVETINHIRWQDEQDTVKLRTLADSVVRDGTAAIDHMSIKAEEILKKNDFDINTGKPSHSTEIANEPLESKSISPDEVAKVIREYNATHAHKGTSFLIDESQANQTFENPTECVNISVDDIGVVEQKPNGRDKDSKPKESTHYVKNTVAHIQHSGKRYIVAGIGIRHVLTIVVAFLLHNALFWGTPIVFFTDGADDIRGSIVQMFGWLGIKMTLDWYHLLKKCKERLSQALKDRKRRHEVLKQLLPLLWHGKVEEAIQYLRCLSNVRNFEYIEQLIAYLDRHRAQIPCYALRRALGLRVSSNLGEKANDLVVAHRQKHKGMSWSQAGSPALANLKALFVNNEADNWILRRELDFSLIPTSTSRNDYHKRLYLVNHATSDKKCA
jgi:hypothetical protein